MTERNFGADQRPTDTDAQRCKDTSDHDVVVAAGGATVGQQMKLHEPGCPCLGNAVETRPPTAGERRSREWCDTCTGDVTQTPSFDAYNALVAAAEDDDLDRGDGIETDGGIEPSTQQQVIDQYSSKAKGGDVFPLDNGVAFVLSDDHPVKLQPTQLLKRHNWYVGGIHVNWENRELSVFAFPLEVEVDE